ncbi:MAG: hypothetical protein UDP13_07975 [Butyricicoccus sp.]|nr:hypothetical protein [Butyricicoccus sp.]
MNKRYYAEWLLCGVLHQMFAATLSDIWEQTFGPDIENLVVVDGKNQKIYRL